MHDVADLKQTATERLEDARALFAAGRFAGAAYLAGYAVELSLKSRICLTLGWPGFPETTNEFKGFQSLKTHDLEVLLRFSGFETTIKTSHLAEWSVVLGWDPTKRYSAATLPEQDARDMLEAAGTLVKVL